LGASAQVTQIVREPAKTGDACGRHRLGAPIAALHWANFLEEAMTPRPRFVFVCVLALVACFWASPASASNIVLNPGFETGSFAPWVASTTSGFAWGVSTGAPHTGNDFAQTGCVGSQCISPDPDPAGAWLYQDLTTTNGQSYNLSFWYFPGSGSPNQLQVRWGGGVVLDLVNSGTGTTYNLYTVSGLVALGSSMRLEFLGRQDPAFNGLDDVCVDTPGGSCASAAAVPEPTSLVLMGTALLGLRRAVRRTR
jgi:hypothetical protein